MVARGETSLISIYLYIYMCVCVCVYVSSLGDCKMCRTLFDLDLNLNCRLVEKCSIQVSQIRYSCSVVL